MFLSAGSFEFQYVLSAETLPASQLLRVAACKNLEISAERNAEAEWLKLEMGAADGGIMPVALSVSPEALEPGEYTATVTVSAPDVFFDPIQIPVVMKVLPPPGQ